MDESAGHTFCNGCHVGSLQPRRATYARWHDEQFVIMPDVPAWRCDFCGAVFYDDQILSRLFMLLGPESGLEDRGRWPPSGLEGSQDSGLGDRRRV